MKKTLLFLLISIISFQGFAQDPDLFQTWYLTDYYYDFGDEYDVIDINPPINPTLTITENLDFSGIGACNDFSGSFTYNNETLTVSNFIPTMVTCEHPEHLDFEQQYFGYFSFEASYSLVIGAVADQQLLYLSGFLFEGMNFSNHPLSTSDFNNINIKIYPNPVSEKLNISSENNLINGFTIYSLAGKKVLDVVNKNSSIDVSGLSEGMYFLMINSSEGKSVQKFIKK